MQSTKNIIICCDGTGNQYGETYSNVVKLFTMLTKSPEQVAFYDPGVGTLSEDNSVVPFSKQIKKYRSLGFGAGLEDNVKEAYSYLMETYQNGDRVFLFGFSRGAFTTRVLAGMISTTGVLEKGCQNLLPYAWQTYRQTRKPKGESIAKQFKKTYSKDVQLHFVGLWDTVTSMGLFNHKRFPFTTNNFSIMHLRHAMSIDERRVYYRQNLVQQTNPAGSIKQVWFAGVHSDVGGSYGLAESELAQVSLEWMLREAEGQGLKIDDKKRDEVLYNRPVSGTSVPDFNGMLHNSLTGLFWWWLECLPVVRLKPFKLRRPSFGTRRNLFKSFNNQAVRPKIHVSVVNRINSTVVTYTPKNLSKTELGNCDIEY